ncbi:hypothetical protein E2C01_058366 [Portunus trituberculatus]|uniref:Uncharacterized protein n=1 Tax=Portunus trituberculatus TaxID=210409 RepID=A0A5B7H3J3_PORTR|nr:hypothetical protein [Portunus trituberculatus]
MVPGAPPPHNRRKTRRDAFPVYASCLLLACSLSAFLNVCLVVARPGPACWWCAREPCCVRVAGVLASLICSTRVHLWSPRARPAD